MNKESKLIPVTRSERVKVAASFIWAFAGTLLITSSVVQASDLQIYASGSSGGQKTFIMMLDTSRSMATFFDDQKTGNTEAAQAYDSNDNPVTSNKSCADVNYGAEGSASTDIRYTVTYSETAPDGTVISYQRGYCTTSKNNQGERYYDRLTRLKDGMFAVLNSNDSRLDSVYMGVGQYPIRDFEGQDSSGNGTKSKILVPAARLGALNSDQRIKLKRAVAGLEAWGQTPMAHAYAEAAAYLLGTSTSGTDSGFSSSPNDTKTADLASYASPLPTTARTCHAQGVYLLTDGEPDNSTDARAQVIMKQALGGSAFSCPSGSATTLSGNSTQAWNCIADFSRALFSATTNPKQRSIVTALAGFNGKFPLLQSGDQQNGCRLGSRTQADRLSNDMCSPGQGSYPTNAPGYGNGGFFAVLTKDQIKNSVVSFITNLNTSVPEPLATGAISVPTDELSPNGLQSFGYLRMLEPNPASQFLIWKGNLKKYFILNGALAEGAAANSDLVFDGTGGFKTNTKDIWNNTANDDGGLIDQGGAYSRVPMPTTTNSAIRSLFTNVASVSGSTLQPITATNTSLLKLPVLPASYTDLNAAVRSQFDASTGQAVLKDFPPLVKRKLLNYLGYDLPLNNTSLPASLSSPTNPFLAMGGIVHSLPVQLTYSGTLDSNGQLMTTRTQSVAYGSMEGGLHIVDASSGVEQMVFVPAEILNDDISRALRKGEAGTIFSHGFDGPWIADPAYKVSDDGNSIKARQMNIYGGLRMGGTSYYGLDVLDPSSPKLLFRAGSDQSDFSRMGQSWSKPVLANIRYNGAIKRVMIVGGGYDTCYESPTFTLAASGSGTTCATTSAAKGNAVYIIDAKTGARLWWASDSGADSNNANMKHSVVSRISALDRNADGLIDHLYFGDLGGQVFRADLNNNQTKTDSSYSSFGVRVARLANLATTDAGAALTDGKNPRFYEAPTVTIHDQAGKTFIVVGIASGNRSTPLDVFPIIGRDGMSPAVALNDRLVNNVYGIIDRDFINKDLMTIADTSLITRDKTLSTFQKDPQTIASGSVISTFFPSSGTGKDGWYRSLSSKSDGTERADNSFRIKGGLKAFEEPIALTGNLIVPVYDPQGTGVATSDSCQPSVVGETDRQLYCLPFGVCLNSNGTINTADELKTGFLTTTDSAKCPVGVSECNDNVLGSGIRGVSLVPKQDDSSNNASCGKLTLAGNITGAGEWQCTRKLNPTRWYEKYTSS